MSGALAGLGTALTFGAPAAAASGLLPAWIRQGRQIGNIIPDVTVHEQHSDRVQVTQHPIADNTVVSDHAFRIPSTLTMSVGWSNANVVGSVVDTFRIGTSPWASFTETRAREIYDLLLDMQRARLPVTIVTGKRTYKNMLLTELSVKTDRLTEYALMVEASSQEVLIATTQTTTQPAATEQQAPDKTQATTAVPDKQAKPAPTKNPDSWFLRLEKGIGSLW